MDRLMVFFARLQGAAAMLQLATLDAALRLIRRTGRRVSWLLISAALFFRALGRSHNLRLLLPGLVPINLFNDAIAVGISLLVLLGVATIRPLLHDLKRSGENLGRMGKAWEGQIAVRAAPWQTAKEH